MTVTHRDVSRHFLTMGEAVELILLASGLEESGGIFVPQVGAPWDILFCSRSNFNRSPMTICNSSIHNPHEAFCRKRPFFDTPCIA